MKDSIEELVSALCESMRPDWCKPLTASSSDLGAEVTLNTEEGNKAAGGYVAGQERALPAIAEENG